MKRVVFACNAGMSTSLLINKIQHVAKEKNVILEIRAMSLSELSAANLDVDAILLGPQVKYGLNRIKSIYATIPVEAINPMVYGTMNAVAVFEQIMRMTEG